MDRFDPHMGQRASKENRAQRRRAQSFENLGEAGLVVIGRRGVYETIVENSTKTADVRKGTFYAHSPSKEDLVHHLVRHGFEELIAAGRGEGAEAKLPADRLPTLIRERLRFLARRRDLVILLDQVRGLLILRPDARQRLRRESQRYIRFLAAECRRVRGGGNLNPRDARDLGCAMAGFVAGILSFEMLVRSGRGLLPPIQWTHQRLCSRGGSSLQTVGPLRGRQRSRLTLFSCTGGRHCIFSLI